MKITSITKNGHFRWLLCLLLGIITFSDAFADNKEVDMQPRWFYTDSINGGVEFPTPQADFAAIQATLNARNSGTGYTYTLTNLRPLPSGTQENNQPANWGYYFVLTDPQGNVMQQGDTWPIVLVPDCGSFGYVQNRKTSTGDTVFYCTNTIVDIDPSQNACPATPYPVFVETGLKRQREVDYMSPDGLLEYTRTWRSDYGQFFTPNQETLIDYSRPYATTSSCYSGYAGMLVNGQKIPVPYCFPYIGIGTNAYQLSTPDGNRIVYTNTNSSFIARADINTTLVQTVNSGVITWTARTENDEIKTFDAVGLLRTRQLKGGRSISYTYSDGNTPNNIAPRPGLMVRMADNFGRSLNFTYNSIGNIQTLTDPIGGLIQYNYDEASGNCPAAIQNGNCQRLTSVTYQDGKVRRYHYNEASNVDPSLSQSKAYLTGITDENSARLSAYKYDAQEHVISSGWGGFNYLLTYDYSTGTHATVQDQLGKHAFVRKNK